ncbi:hypothetical protein DSECCO2_598220 [anaerobic digester metagenome]
MEIPSSGTNIKRSFMNVPMLKSRLDAMENVAQKIRMPMDTGDFFFNPRKNTTIENSTMAMVIRTTGLLKSVMAICFG